MTKIVILSALFVTLTACTDSDSNSGSYKEGSIQWAQSLSPTGETCERTVRTPISRGRGHGLEGKYKEETTFLPGYLRGDVNGDGVINKDDAHLATKKFFKPENFECPATADVGGYPQTETPDTYFTSQDIFIFKEFRKTGVITWPIDVICSDECEIINHMTP